jgi:HSP20 family molecular chaperone IbpA
MGIIPRKRSEERALAERAGDPFGYLPNQINRVFDDFWGESWLAPRGEMAGFWPQVDVTETDKEVKVCAEIPGVDAKDIDVSVEEGTHTIKARKSTSSKRRRKGFIEWSAVTARSSAQFLCRRKSMNRKPKPSSRNACCV